MTDLDKLVDWFPKDSWPGITCPVCRTGEMSIVSVSTFEGPSARWRSHEAWEPDWIRGYFTAALKCQRRNCDEAAVALGEMKVDYQLDENGNWFGEWDEFVKVRQVLPAPPLANFIPTCPENVKARLEEAARVVWSDPGAAANRLRVAIECVLDDQGVDRVSARGAQLTTHARIAEFRKRHPAVADALEAVKWIGNQGSHEDTLTQADVVEGAQILAHALELLYDTRAEEIAQRVKAINQARRLPGPGAS